MTEPLGTCRVCGGSLQRVPSMPGHVVCGSGHLYLEHRGPAAGGQAGASHLHRLGTTRPAPRR